MGGNTTGRRAGGPVRLEEVARIAGVSPITVSRALTSPEKVKEETRRRVAEAVEKTGYVVNSFASMLRSGRSSIVSVFVSGLQNPNFASAIQGCADVFDGSGYHLLMAQASYSATGQEAMLQQVLPLRPAAVMFTGILKSEAARAQLRALGIPVMETWDERPDPVDMLVGCSNEEGGRLMGRHLAERGFRRVAFAGRTGEGGAQRLEGFRAGLGELGRDVDFVLPIEAGYSIAEGRAAFEAVYAALPDCDAMFFGTDTLAAGALLQARRYGMSVPGSIAIAGYGDLDYAAQLQVPLTSVHVPGYELGRTAGALLRRRLEGRKVREPVRRLPLQLVVRESTGPGGDAAAEA